ncbi:MAG: ATP-NAD kinase family protein [Bacillota bacterium]|nr:ATP-NAD kinase family protein [Bacillota bacterium]MDW7676708.1 ATP-NAD kinase family protein [Bacillota bacterium]
MKKLGLIVNPVAGMGGSVGLKGTDGLADQARALGAVPRSAQRTRRALQQLEPLRQDLEIWTAPGNMGETLLKEMGWRYRVLPATGSRADDKKECSATKTTGEDTRRAARELADQPVDLLLFAGGDGTARDICEAVGESVIAVGIPAGVKIHSPVYAVSPDQAGELARRFLRDELIRTKTAEVLDIDEDAYRQGRVSTRLYGYLKVPDDARLMQNRKSGSVLSEEAAQKAIALRMVDDMVPEVMYLVGPGSTTRPVMEALSLPGTLLGVDIVCNKQLVAADVSEKQILEQIAGRESRILITPIGGQGYLFGRGNQQLSPRVIRQAGIHHLLVMATLQKIQSLTGRPFLVDTGDPALDRQLSGYVRVQTGYRESVMYRVTA